MSTANLFLEVEDVNDNAPVFEQKEYSRTVREGATSFQPQLFVRVSLHFSDVTDLLMHCGFCLVSNFLANHKINNMCFILFFKASGIPKGGGGLGVQTPPRNSEGPPKWCQNQPYCENC